MAEEQVESQAPLAELLDHDPIIAEWIERAVTVRVPLPLAVWDHGEPPEAFRNAHEILDRHDSRLAAIIGEVGWPGRSLVGEGGADAAWLLAQHADRHQAARVSWLPLLEQAFRAGNADARHLSRLTDRVALIKGAPQPYGTYARLDEGGEILWDIPPEGTIEEVEFRRNAIGLPPLIEDLAEPPGVGPYRYLRGTPAFAWPPEAVVPVSLWTTDVDDRYLARARPRGRILNHESRAVVARLVAYLSRGKEGT